MRIQKNKIVYNVGKSRSISFYDQRDKNFIENKFNIKDLSFSLGESMGIKGLRYHISLFHEGVSPGSNGRLFYLENIDKYEFQKRVLGYTYKSGDFPDCKTAEDAMELLNELLKSILK